MEKRFNDVKKIVGNKYSAGMYACSDMTAVQLLDVNNRVVVNLKLRDKIDIFSIVIQKMLNNGLSDELLSLERLFDVVMDVDARELEESINKLFHKTIFLYSKPNIDIKEVLSIADLVSNKLNEYSNNNADVKQELRKKIYYV